MPLGPPKNLCCLWYIASAPAYMYVHRRKCMCTGVYVCAPALEFVRCAGEFGYINVTLDGYLMLLEFQECDGILQI